MGKSVFKSKVLWVQLFGAIGIVVAAFNPKVGAFIQENFSAVGGGWIALNAGLRFLTKGKIQIG